MTTEILIGFGLIALFYLIVANRLIALVHPARMEMAELGASLLQSDLSQEAKKYVTYNIDNAYSARRAWFFVFLVPFAVVHLVFFVATGREPKHSHSCPADVRDDFDRFMRLSFWSVICSSPLAAALIIAQLGIYLLLFVPIGVIIRDTAKTAAVMHENQVRLHELLATKLQA